MSVNWDADDIDDYADQIREETLEEAAVILERRGHFAIAAELRDLKQYRYDPTWDSHSLDCVMVERQCITHRPMPREKQKFHLNEGG